MQRILPLLAALFLVTACAPEPQTATVDADRLRQYDRVLDQAKIDYLTSSFTDAVNQRDPDQFAELWIANGAAWTVGPPVDTVFNGRDNMAEAVSLMLSQWDYFYQSLEGSVVDFSADGLSAAGRVYLNERGETKAGAGNHNLSFYEDEYRKVGNDWLFATRTYRTIYQEAPASPGERYWRPE